MFPGKVLLGVEEIATLLNVSAGHIKNLCYMNRLPFKLHKDKSLSNRIQVSIIELARYLDSKLENVVEEDKKEDKPPVPSMIVQPKKRGRPRGVTRRQAFFQSSLQLAIIEYEVSILMDELTSNIKEISNPPSECQALLEEMKDSTLKMVDRTKIGIAKSFLELKLYSGNQKKNIGIKI